MKVKWVFFLLGVLALIWFTACSDDDAAGRPGFNGTQGGNNQTNNTNAPLSLVGVTISHTITSGTAPLPSSGTFLVEFTGTTGSTSGDFRTFEPGGTQSSGTFTSVSTGANTAVVVFVDPILGTVTEELLFFTTTSGTFVRNVGPGQSRQGTFVFQ